MANLCQLRGETSADGEAALTEVRLVGDGTIVSVSVSMVRPPIGSTSAAFGDSSAACSPDLSGVIGMVLFTTSLSTGAASTVSDCSLTTLS